eukprot:TRINITY_DN7499_c0_g1_i2.p1 TRINITY_DN7499_c0_g1~~TRINITY_DN7499_c0_g1_i2.p1  ORF type:complete len:121 (-),score=20.63 TRINITY_DN7499_c0_g1_i2:217-579(-)
MNAVIQRYELETDNAPPISVRISRSKQRGEVGVRVSDAGGGVPIGDLSRVMRYFFTTTPPMVPTYTYSVQFGAPLSGIGVGLPFARLYARLMGGDLRLASLPGHGTDVHIVLDALGRGPL